METSEFNTDIFYKADRKFDEEQANDIFNISPLLFKGDGVMSDITDTNKINSRLINIHKIMLDSDYLPEPTETKNINTQMGGFSVTSEQTDDNTVSATSSYYPDETESAFSLPMNFSETDSHSFSSFSYSTEEGLTTTTDSNTYSSTSHFTSSKNY